MIRLGPGWLRPRVLCLRAGIRKLRHMRPETDTRPILRRHLALAAAVSGICLLALASCTKNTDPVGGIGDVTIAFHPAAQGQQIDLSETLDFLVTVTEADTMDVNWIRNGVVISNAAEYNYVPSELGIDTLRVQVAAGTVARNYFWVINVLPSGNTLPIPVQEIAAGPGPEAGDVEVSWNRGEVGSFPLVEYVVAVSFTGPITPDNWDQAVSLRRVPHRVSTVRYVENFTVAEDEMIPGAEAWFGVRAIDDLGQMSPISANGFTTVTRAWWINGIVRDDMGLTHPGIIVASVDPQISTNTDNSGVYRLGPFRSIDRVAVRTTSSNAPISGWFDFESAPLDSITGRDFEIMLITRHLLAAGSTCTNHDGQFLLYLRYMAKTEVDPNNVDNTKQLKWESYPLRAYLPDVSSASGVAFDEAGRFALAFWNSVMGEDYFVETTDPDNAEMIFRFDQSIPLIYGRVSLLEPAGPDLVLGNVIPEKVEVYLNLDERADEQFAREVALHELGHVLGLLNHSACADAGYMMTSAGGSLLNPSPIHPDEQRAVRCIRRLAQGVDMNGYRLN